MSVERDVFQLSSKFVLNEQRDKVLYAKVGRDFVDSLLSFLTLPLGTIVRLLVRQYVNEAPVLGSLGYLYKGLENLNTRNFYFETSKLLLLQPRNSFQVHCQKLKLNIDDTTPIKYYICQGSECKYPKFVSLYYDNMTCNCGRPMNLEVSVDDSNTEIPSEGGVFLTSHTQSFIVTDDLQISPYSPESELQILRDSDFDYTSGLKEIKVDFGYSKMMILLKCFLISNTPLTDTILYERQMISSQNIPFVPQKCKHNMKSKSKKMSVTAFVQKSTNKILAVHAQEDFVHFVFSLLTIPLGKVLFLLDGNSGLSRVDNLYRSVPNLIGGKLINTQDHSINSILSPRLPPNYVSWFNQILPLTEQSSHTLFYRDDDLPKSSIPLVLRPDDLKKRNRRYKMSTSHFIPGYSVAFSRTINPKGLKPNGYLVTDNLDVTIAFDSSFSSLQQTGIALSDVEKHVLDVGTEEAVNILKASLSSSYALTNGLQKCLLRQQSKKSEVSKIPRAIRWC